MRPDRIQRAVLPLLLAAAIVPQVAVAQPKPAPANPAAQPKPPPANPAAQAALLGQFGDWGAYTASPGGSKVCFALAKPASMVDTPANRRTAANPVYMFISTRPGEKVKDEVSVLVTGYQLKGNTEATATVGSANFAMYTQNDGAWVKNAAEESQLVDALRKGQDVVIKATTAKGTKTTDTFSLKGFSQALDRVAQECK
jgi:invasion protein IalB